MSQEYTSDSNRASAVALLDHSNFHAHDIMRVSGHNLNLVLGHTRLPESKQNEMLDALSAARSVDHAILPFVNLPTNNENLELTWSQFQHALGSLRNSPLSNHSLPRSPYLVQNSSVQQTTLKNDVLLLPV